MERVADVEVAGGISGERIGTDSLQPTPATLPNVSGKRSITQGNSQRELNIVCGQPARIEAALEQIPRFC